MKIQIVYSQKMDFTSQDGNKVKGMACWYLEENVKTDFAVGLKPTKIWINDEQQQRLGIDELPLGDCEIEFGPKNKIVSFKKVR